MTTASIHWFSRFPRRLAQAFGLGVGILVLGAIAPPPSPSQGAVNPQAQPLRLSGMSRALTSSSITQLDQPLEPSNTLRVAVYTPGASCAGFIPTVITVPEEQSVTAVVHHLLTDPELALIGFDVSGYRVLQTGNGRGVTVDFRLPPQSGRQWISLSICEQQIVLGSLRKTLLENPTLAVDTVQFTERGQPLQL